MSDSSNREALDGLLGAVAAAAGQSGPEWLEAYISLIANEYLDRHHVGLWLGSYGVPTRSLHRMA